MDSLTQTADEARRAGPARLAALLQAARADTLATYAAYEAAGALQVPCRAELNPPLWELGHVGWFQEWWIARNPERARGSAADPDVARPPPVRAAADALYDSSRVPHDDRWRLPLPDAAATRADLAAQLDRTLALLAHAGEDDDALYFWRLALFHEDMHREAALYMAQSLDLPLDLPRPAPLPEPPPALVQGPAVHALGTTGPGFAFDNELAGQALALPAHRIDAQVCRWAEFLPFVECGAYADDRHWSATGRDWRGTRAAPRYLERDGRHWRQRRAGRWQPLDPATPAMHLSFHEAEAWCRWAGRRLPTEAEWERAALTMPSSFTWGQVWEWTASPFAPYPGFRAHPYRDYSQPWFDGRPVLRGASVFTQPRMRHPKYRNYFPPGRNDIAAGFRTCAMSPEAPSSPSSSASFTKG